MINQSWCVTGLYNYAIYVFFAQQIDNIRQQRCLWCGAYLMLRQLSEWWLNHVEASQSPSLKISKDIYIESNLDQPPR